MQDASTRRQRCLHVERGFETSRLENGLLAAAYEHAVPIISRRTGQNKRVVLDEAASAADVSASTNVQPSLLTKEGQVA